MNRNENKIEIYFSEKHQFYSIRKPLSEWKKNEAIDHSHCMASNSHREHASHSPSSV